MDKKDTLMKFHEWLSSLNYFSELNDRQLDAQQIMQTDLLLHKKQSQVFQQVPLRFASEDNYQKIWEKLFYDEVKAQIIRSKVQEVKEPQIIQIIKVDSLNAWFRLISFRKITNTNITYTHGTFVIISPVQPQKNKQYPYLIGFIQSGQPLVVKAPLNQKLKQLKPEQWELMVSTKKWYIQQICSINTLERQYFALKYFPFINKTLKQIIMKPDQHTKQMVKKFRIPHELDDKLRIVYNDSQYKAINECLKQTGITMIQGPPGTGKTKTVLGTLSILLSSYHKPEEQQQAPLIMSWKKSAEIMKQSKLLNPWLYSDYRDWRDQPFIHDEQDQLGLSKFYVHCEQSDRKMTVTKKYEGIQLPGKVLICGPSNASVDQIIRKLLNQKLLDSHGQLYLPAFVRVGQNYDPSLKQHSLQYLAEKLSKKQSGLDIMEFRKRVLKQSRLVFGTLSSVGSNAIQNSNTNFDTVVIDEAGQSIQISNLIPLIYNCQRLILIGDPNQLPATIFSSKSLEHHYDQSLFERLMKSGYPVSVLRTQYRMHPQISEVIGKHFYGQKLSNWDNLIIQEPKSTPTSFLIFHVDKSHQSPFKKSYRNIVEAKIVKDIAMFLSKNYKDIGIVSPYSQQVSLIQSISGKGKFQIKTIDSFQGREKDVIIFSAVRSRYIWRNKKEEQNKRKTIGFVGDVRRINVSLSRAKHICIIVGDIHRLSINNTWKNIITDAINRNQVYEFSNKKNYLQNLIKNPKESVILKM